MSASDLALSIRRICKSYTIQQNAQRRDTMVETLMDRVRKPLRRAKNETFTALKDVSFDVKKGEVVGIIGRNGAGKSTLLKILSRITEPSSGEIDLYGRIGSLLEVGTGFHPELTGRENIFLNGAILGMTKGEIRKHFDAIVDFAEVEKFLDTPVKRYSSGMYVRLAFAVAAHLNSEILIVDEVLAVGDTQFQRKCIGKMGRIANEGRTVLFVSHHMPTISALCSHCILLERGSVKNSGSPSSLIGEYLRGADRASSEYVPEPGAEPGNDLVRLMRVSVRSPDGGTGPEFAAEMPLDIEITYRVERPTAGLRIGFRLLSQEGIVVFTSTDMDDEKTNLDDVRRPGEQVSRCRIPAAFLNQGQYTVSVGCDIAKKQVNFFCENVVSFSLEMVGGQSDSRYDARLGFVCPQLEWAAG